jgi:hypothetical protein
MPWLDAYFDSSNPWLPKCSSWASILITRILVRNANFGAPH